MAASAPRTPITWGVALRVLGRATANYVEDGCTHISASVSYFALFSIFPITLLAVSVFGIVIRDPEIQRDVLDYLVEAIPVSAPSVDDSLRGVATLGPTFTVLSLLGTVWAASALTTAVRRGVNVAFDVDDSRPMLRGKLIDYAALPVLGLILLASVVLNAVWRVMRTNADIAALDRFPLLWEAGALLITLGLTFLAFLYLYRVLPNRTVRLEYLAPGALVAAVGFQVATQGFSVYVANIANYDVVYGSLGGVVALLFWVYVSANIMLFGAEVAAEVPHVMEGRSRHGRADALEVDWRQATWQLVRGLVLSPVAEEPTDSPRARRRARAAARAPGGEAPPAPRAPAGPPVDAPAEGSGPDDPTGTGTGTGSGTGTGTGTG